MFYAFYCSSAAAQMGDDGWSAHCGSKTLLISKWYVLGTVRGVLLLQGSI